jgi:leader peptidase (prepilin peptidase) / N-methyltransferase
MVAAFAFLLGAAVGSFLNVCIDRLPRGESLATPPSHCEGCGRRLQPLELIPIVSYLALRGRCRTCGAKIPLRVAAVELVSGLLYTLIWLRFGWTIEAVLSFAFVSVLVVIAFIDYEHHRILNILTFPAIALALVAAVALPGRPPLFYLLGGLLGGGSLYLLALASPRAMGFGDVKLGALLGLILGYPIILVGLFLAFVIGGAVSLILLAAKRVERGKAVAFGPYLALGGTLALLYGERLLAWWLMRT